MKATTKKKVYKFVKTYYPLVKDFILAILTLRWLKR